MMFVMKALYVMMLIGSLGLSPENAADRSTDILVFVQQEAVQIDEGLEAGDYMSTRKMVMLK